MTDPTPANAARRPPRKPTAFRLDDERVRFDADDLGEPLSDEARIVPARESTDEAPPPAPEPGRGIRFGRWLAAGLGGLMLLAAGLAVDGFVRDLFARTDWLGWTGLALAGLALAGLLGLAAREAAGLARLRRIDHLRAALAAAAEADDAKAARAALADLLVLYGERAETAHGRAALAAHLREVIDGRDLVVLAERELLAPLDVTARRLVADSAKRVSLVTAVSPRALIDLIVVLAENLRLIRRLSALYGGRPGTLGFLRLARHVAAHLAVTGGMAAGDSLVSQVLGHGLAARLSARLGEGVVNGLLTARIGIAAADVCRPAPYIGGRGPRIADFMTDLVKTLPDEGKETGRR
ncbi:YcjF family protein [Polymorphum gilvum]|uniref:Membrane protein n=1 Tax=Polymorphum gilvum (strain LMG 25793 / CGMCC 1.9160 / SL003B-26A1) TaxID=991905 RepID=F2J414_POLGS|nr:TIGR01620 family protein [Polymorphum gilvum]ADZ69940.1 Membrane protein [Polymorphum gilvum SL003B-26A1]